MRDGASYKRMRNKWAEGKQRTFPGALALKDSRETCAVPAENRRGYWIPIELEWQAAVSCLSDRVLGIKFRSFKKTSISLHC